MIYPTPEEVIITFGLAFIVILIFYWYYQKYCKEVRT